MRSNRAFSNIHHYIEIKYSVPFISNVGTHILFGVDEPKGVPQFVQMAFS